MEEQEEQFKKEQARREQLINSRLNDLKEKLAALYVKRIKTCYKLLKISAIALVVCVFALVIFVSVCAGTGVNSSNPNVYYAGVVAIGFAALLFAVMPLICFLVAKAYLNKLKKLGGQDE